MAAPVMDALYGDAERFFAGALGGPTGGQDTFVFAGVFGHDRVFDFRQGEDLLEFAVPGIDDIGDLLIGSDAGGTLITVAGFGSVRLVGFAGDLTQGDITIA